MTILTIILWAIAGFLAFWAGVIALIGFAGWKPLAERFPAERWPEDEGVVLGWQSGRIGMSGYNNVLNAVVADDGLYLRPARLFAYNHAPILIPWDAMEVTGKGLFGGISLALDGGGGLSLYGRVAKEVKAQLDAPASALPLGDEVWEEDGAAPRTARRRRQIR